MRIFIYIKDGDLLSVAKRLSDHDHDVMCYMENKAPNTYQNLLDFTPTWQTGLRLKPDVALFESGKTGKIAELFKRANIPVLNGGVGFDRMGNDAKFEESIIRSAGINVIPFKQISRDDAIRTASDEKRYAIRNKKGRLLHLTSEEENPVDRLTMLDDEEVILQDFVESIPITTEGWFNGEEFVEGCFGYSMPEKHFLVGNLGPKTGYEGKVFFLNKNMKDKLVRNLVRMAPILKANKCSGCIRLKTLVDSNNGRVFGLGFDTGAHYENFLELAGEQDFGEFLHDVASKGTPSLKLADKCCASVKVSIPPYPTTNLYDGLNNEIRKRVSTLLNKDSVNEPIDGYQDFENSCYWQDIFMDKETEVLRCAGNNGIIGLVCGTGDTINEAKKTTYEKLRKLDLKDKQYRIDIGTMALKVIPRLQDYGLLTGRGSLIYAVEGRGKSRHAQERKEMVKEADVRERSES